MRYTLIVAAVCLAASVAFTQEPVVPAINVEALFRDSNKKLNENKQVAYHIERDLLQCKRWNQADRWLTERYIQHNPTIPSGRSAIVQLFGSHPAPETCDEKLDAPVVAVLAEGDLVAVFWVANLKDSKGENYTTTLFDMWRIVGGKADEHWDPMVKR
jgi:predicted SnoaL-like aldol condensation-catalyzing enzyme